MLNLDVVFDPDRKPCGVASVELDSPARGMAGPDDLPADWRVEFEERAAVRESDGRQAREHAEAEAFTEILARMRAAGEFSGGPLTCY